MPLRKMAHTATARTLRRQKAPNFAVEFGDLIGSAYQMIWNFHDVVPVLRHWARHGLDSVPVADADGVGPLRAYQCSMMINEYEQLCHVPSFPAESLGQAAAAQHETQVLI